MKREIKFRGKSTQTGEWVYGSLNTYYDSGNGSVTIWGEYNDFENVDPSSVGQFTGLTDINGVEIYEGDILRVQLSDGEYLNHCVIFSTDKGGYVQCLVYEPNGYIIDSGLLDQIYINFTEKTVIGNIHDNKELIAKQQ